MIIRVRNGGRNGFLPTSVGRRWDESISVILAAANTGGDPVRIRSDNRTIWFGRDFLIPAATGKRKEKEMAEQAAQNDHPVEEKIIEMEIERLRDFRNHPFHVKDDAEMEDLKNSIRRFGILSPIIVRPMQDGAYEIISGHRRKHAAKSLGYRKVPVIIRALEDDDAVISMVDSNLHREWISYSEKAFAIKMKYEAMKRNTGRRKKGSQREARPKGIRTVHILGEETGDSPKQIQRFLKITELIPEMMEQLDQNGISFNPAYEIAFLPENSRRSYWMQCGAYSQPHPCHRHNASAGSVRKEN